MKIAQGYAHRPKRIHAVEKFGFFHFIITLGYPFCTNFLQTFPHEKMHLFELYCRSVLILKICLSYKEAISVFGVFRIYFGSLSIQKLKGAGKYHSNLFNQEVL